MAKHPLEATWRSMRERCNNPNCRSYPSYGGKGVFVCERWAKFKNFLEDMGEKPEGTTLDRINGLDGYYKENCRWATREQQSANRDLGLHNPARNALGVKGVYEKTPGYFSAFGSKEKKVYSLYHGSSFEAAVEARRQWELTGRDAK